MQRIIFKISPVGKPTIEADGYSGRSCLDATAPYEARLSGGGADRVEKPEINNIETTVEEENEYV